MSLLEIVLVILAAIFAFVEIAQSNGRSFLSWAVLMITIVLALILR